MRAMYFEFSAAPLYVWVKKDERSVYSLRMAFSHTPDMLRQWATKEGG